MEGEILQSTPQPGQQVLDCQQPKLFNRNLQEMSEMMNSVDFTKSSVSEKQETLSADAYSQTEEVSEEKVNVNITPAPSAEEIEEQTKVSTHLETEAWF